MSEIKFTKKENETVNKVLKTYADAMEENSNKYWTSNRKDSKPYEDSLIGKKGEFFVAKYIKQQHGFEIKPDVEIYTSKKKNWSADLPYTTAGYDYPDCHVKTCSQKTVDYAKTYTWTFQLNNGFGKGGTDRLLSSDEYDSDLVALVFVPHWESDVADICVLDAWGNLRKHLRDPKSPRLKGIKTCLYVGDLITKE